MKTKQFHGRILESEYLVLDLIKSHVTFHVFAQLKRKYRPPSDYGPGTKPDFLNSEELLRSGISPRSYSTAINNLIEVGLLKVAGIKTISRFPCRLLEFPHEYGDIKQAPTCVTIAEAVHDAKTSCATIADTSATIADVNESYGNHCSSDTEHRQPLPKHQQPLPTSQIDNKEDIRKEETEDGENIFACSSTDEDEVDTSQDPIKDPVATIKEPACKIYTLNLDPVVASQVPVEQHQDPKDPLKNKLKLHEYKLYKDSRLLLAELYEGNPDQKRVSTLLIQLHQIFDDMIEIESLSQHRKDGRLCVAEWIKANPSSQLLDPVLAIKNTVSNQSTQVSTHTGLFSPKERLAMGWPAVPPGDGHIQGSVTKQSTQILDDESLFAEMACDEPDSAVMHLTNPSTPLLDDEDLFAELAWKH